MKVYVLSPPVQYVRIQLNSRAYDVCERKFNGRSVGLNVEKLHDLDRYSIKYRPTMRLNVLYSPISRISVATGHNHLDSVRFALLALVSELRIWHNKIKKKTFKETHERDECGPYYFYLFTCLYFISTHTQTD